MRTFFQSRRQFPQHLQPLGHAEHRTLLRVAQNRHDQFFKDFGPALDQIEVPISGRIKRTGIDSKALMQSSSQERIRLTDILCGDGRLWQCSGDYGNFMQLATIDNGHPERSEESWYAWAITISPRGDQDPSLRPG